MINKRKFLLILLAIALCLGCRFTSPTPVAWVPSATAEVHSQTDTASARDQATQTAQATPTRPKPTPTNPPPTPTIAEDGPWLVFANQAGTCFYAHDAESGALISLDLPPAVDPLDLESGISPDGKHLLVRAGRTEELNELAFYQIVNPWQQPEKVTSLLSEKLQQDILAEKGRQPKMALRAVQQPDPVSWSAESSQAVFPLALDGLSSDLYLYDAHTGALQRLTDRFQQEFAPLWSPGERWLVFQDVNSYATPDNWKISLIGAWKMPKQNQMRYLFVPEATGYWEHYVGWMSAEELVSYTKTESGGTDLRLSNLSTDRTTILFYGPFHEVALDPNHGTLAVSMNAADGKNSGHTPGIYISKSGRLLYSLLISGDYEHLEYLPKLGHFIASGKTGVIQFDDSGILARLNDEQRATFSPEGEWIVGWGTSGARLYYTDGTLLQSLTDQPVSAVVWQKNGQSIYLLEEGGLYQLRFPLLRNQLVTADVYREDERAFAWLAGR